MAGAKKPSKSQKGQWTKAALEASAARKQEHDKLLAEAVAYCGEHDCRGRKACKQEQFKGKLNWWQIDYVLDRPVVVRNKYDVLTTTELDRLKEWMRACEAKNNPAKDPDIRGKVREFLVARALFNRKHHGRKNLEYLTGPEWDIVKRKSDQLPSHTWMLRNLYSDPTLKPKKAKAQDAKRAGKQREEVLAKHFDGETGLYAELIDAGNMDAETRELLDPRRYINLDEMPEFLDYLNGKGGYAWGTVGKPLQIQETENKETASVMMAGDAGGFMYGVQFLVKRAGFTWAMTDCLDAPDWALKFDNQIYELEQKSTYCLVTANETGMQTGTTFLDCLKFLRRQIDHRNRLLRERGRKEIAFPITLSLDNHASRFDIQVLRACKGDATGLGFRLFFEESGTSGFLQMWDQINKSAHTAYKKARKEYKTQYEAKYDEPPDIGVPEFLEIWGGCRDLNLQGAWFTWCSSQMIVSAFRKVGVLSGRLDASQVCRDSFKDRMPGDGPAHPAPEQATPAAAEPSSPSQTTVEAVSKTPEGMRSGSLAALKAQLAAARAHAQALESNKFDPKNYPELVKPKETLAKKRARSGRRLNSGCGSATLAELLDQKEEVIAEEATAAAAVEARKAAWAARADEATAAAAALQSAWEKCGKGCICGLAEACPIKGLKRCSTCGDIKSRVCIKKPCVAARRPLLITFVPPATAPALPAPPQAT